MDKHIAPSKAANTLLKYGLMRPETGSTASELPPPSGGENRKC